MRETIRSYFESLPAYRDTTLHLKDDDSLIALGVIDSFGILELVAFLEESFKVEVQPEDMKREHFESINAIHHFVETKLGVR